VSCGVGRRRGLDLVWLWLWRRPVATAPIRPLAWEPPYATGVALKSKKSKSQKKKKGETEMIEWRGQRVRGLEMPWVWQRGLVLYWNLIKFQLNFIGRRMQRDAHMCNGKGWVDSRMKAKLERKASYINVNRVEEDWLEMAKESNNPTACGWSRWAVRG